MAIFLNQTGPALYKSCKGFGIMVLGKLCDSSGATGKSRMRGEVDFIKRVIPKERGQSLY